MGLLDDPEVLRFLSQFAPDAEQQKRAKANQWVAFGSGLLGAKKGREGEALGRAASGAALVGENARQNARYENAQKMQMGMSFQQFQERQRAQAAAQAQAGQLQSEVGAAFQPNPQPDGSQQSPYAQLAQVYARNNNPDAAAKYHKMAGEGGKELKETRTLTMNGKRVTVNIYKDGSHEILPFEPDKEKAHFANTGKGITPLDPFSGAPQGQTVPVGPSYSDDTSRGQLGVSQAQLALARAREAREAQNAANPAGTYDAERGVVVNTRQGTAAPVTMGGQPLGAKPSQSARKELEEITSQQATIKAAINAAKATPSAFGFWRGMATEMGASAETLAGRTESEAETLARAFVFNNVSSVITARAGTAQTPHESARLRAFLPAPQDGPDKVVQKLQGYERYLEEKRGVYSGATSPNGTKPISNGWSIEPAP